MARLKIGQWAAGSTAGPEKSGTQDRFAAVSDCFIVCDGAGGMDTPDIAATLAVGAAAEVLARLPHVPSSRDCTAAVMAAHQRLVAEMEARGGLIRMGATVTVAAIGFSDVSVSNLGDSPAFLLTRAGLVALTDPQNEAREAVFRSRGRSGRSTPPGSSRLTQFAGMRSEPSPAERIEPASPGDTLILCSDGLSSALTQPDFERSLISATNPQQAVDELLALAKVDAIDDATVVVCKLERR